MARYHISSKGEPAICRATKRACPLGGEHYPSKEAALESIAKATVAKPLRKKNSKHEKLLANFRNLGFTIFLAEDYSPTLIHEVSDKRKVPKVGKIRSVKGDGVGFPDKPIGTLWLSPLETVEDQPRSAWRSWAEMNGVASYTSDLSYQVKLKPDAVILELDENTWVNLPKVWDPTSEGFKRSPHGFSVPTIEQLSGKEPLPKVEWTRLKETGVSAVRLNGWSERGHFYGWDCDSVVVLDGDSVESVELWPNRP